MKPRAINTLRSSPPYRNYAFTEGFKRLGYEVIHGFSEPKNENDVLIIWNRYGDYDALAKRFEAAGATVLVVENGYIGNYWQGTYWYAIAQGNHNGAGRWPENSNRWKQWKVSFKPMRRSDDGIVLVLPQRGIGSPGVAMPGNWLKETLLKLSRYTRRPIYVRKHPGREERDTLYDDLSRATYCVTWGSGAAIKALIEGIPVIYWFENWIGGPAGISHQATELLKNEQFLTELDYLENARERMFERLAGAMWNIAEIENGEAIRGVLSV